MPESPGFSIGTCQGLTPVAWSQVWQWRRVQGFQARRWGAGNFRRDRLTREHSYTYSVLMKNITLSVDEGTLLIVRRYAAERNSSVNSLVREFLAQIARREDRAREARNRLLELSRRSKADIGSGTWTRQELYES